MSLTTMMVISTTLQGLESATGHAVTGGGSLLPMAGVIRQAAAAHHYLGVFDEHTEELLYLGRSKRLASKGQRIVLYACAARYPLLLWPLPGGCELRSRKLWSEIYDPVAAAGAATARLRPHASLGPPFFTATFDHLTVASLDPQHHPDQPCHDRRDNNKHQERRHITPPSLR
jgi:hypothetical protein